MQFGVLDVDQVAELLGCSAETVKQQAATGRLPHVRFGRSPVFPVDALLQHLNARALAGMQTPAPLPKAVAVAPVRRGRRELPKLPNLDGLRLG